MMSRIKAIQDVVLLLYSDDLTDLQYTNIKTDDPLIAPMQVVKTLSCSVTTKYAIIICATILYKGVSRFSTRLD